MKPERWKQIDKLLSEALEMDLDKRAAFLDEACAGNEALRNNSIIFIPIRVSKICCAASVCQLRFFKRRDREVSGDQREIEKMREEYQAL
jgi:hypothetical protein